MWLSAATAEGLAFSPSIAWAVSLGSALITENVRKRDADEHRDGGEQPPAHDPQRGRAGEPARAVARAGFTLELDLLGPAPCVSLYPSLLSLAGHEPDAL